MVLLSTLVFGLMSIMAYRGLTTMLQSRDHLAQESRKWRDAALLFARIEQDLAMLAPRPGRDVNEKVRRAPRSRPQSMGTR